MPREGSTLEELDPALQERLARLPREPGVYLLQDRDGAVIYIGKAQNLWARVRSYFARSGDTRAFVGVLGAILGDVQTIVTHNAKEALLLENTLIKQHRPRFNVMLRDDKSYLVLRLDPRKAYPRLEIGRQIHDDGARYFGPYHAAAACRETLRVVNRHFLLRSCTDRAMAARTRPCLQHQIGRCLAPCVLPVDPEQYARQVEDVTLFLRGREEDLLAQLTARMEQAAAALHFEAAARLRDQIAAVQRSLEAQQVVGTRLVDRDAFGLYREGSAVDFAVLNVRRGKLLRRRSFSFSGQEFPDHELLASLVNLYYDAGQEIPDEILLPVAVEDAEAKRQWLGELRGRPVTLAVPRRGEKRQLVALATHNAQSSFASRRRREIDAQDALERVRRRLRLARLPRRIECYDISSLSGQLVVGSLVVLQDGAPRPADYRRFKIDVGAPTDDFGALYQVLARRLRRARDGDRGWELPELLVVDGGKGHLSAAAAALRDAELPPGTAVPDLVALAKARDAEPDRVFLARAKDPVKLRPNTAELFLLARARDEAHRFAVAYHQQLRRRRTLRSGLEDIPGIGPGRRKGLLRAFGSLRAVREASPDELAAVPGMTARAAEAVARYFAGAGRADPDPAAREDRAAAAHDGEDPAASAVDPAASREER